MKNEIKIKITPNNPKNESGLIRLIMAGESIRQIWVKSLNFFTSSYYIPGGTPDSISADLAGPAPFLDEAYTDMVYLVVAARPVIV